MLYIDLDGVLADFDKKVKEIFGKSADRIDVRVFWKTVANHPNFFGSLDLIPDARFLWGFVKPHQPTILTGLPYGKWAAPQKREWVARVLGPEVPVITCMSKDKANYCEPGDVLVDDRLKTKAPWEDAGGIFIHHVSAFGSINQLKELGY